MERKIACALRTELYSVPTCSPSKVAVQTDDAATAATKRANFRNRSRSSMNSAVNVILRYRGVAVKTFLLVWVLATGHDNVTQPTLIPQPDMPTSRQQAEAVADHLPHTPGSPPPTTVYARCVQGAQR
jgi:hypothetical protein